MHVAAPTLHVVAGPNGSGKSTLTRSKRFGAARVIDPDIIAQGLGHDVDKGVSFAAGREAARQRRAALAQGETFVLETTIAGKAILRIMEQARLAGYRVALHFVSVSSPTQAIDRISNRVAMGGHDVPEADVRRRFPRSLANLPEAISRADESTLYDNSSPEEPYREVAILTRQKRWFAENPPRWAVAAARGLQPRP